MHHKGTTKYPLQLEVHLLAYTTSKLREDIRIRGLKWALGSVLETDRGIEWPKVIGAPSGLAHVRQNRSRAGNIDMSAHMTSSRNNLPVAMLGHTKARLKPLMLSLEPPPEFQLENHHGAILSGERYLAHWGLDQENPFKVHAISSCPVPLRNWL